MKSSNLKIKTAISHSQEFLSLYFKPIEGIDRHKPSAYSFQIRGDYINILQSFDKSGTKDEFIQKGHFYNIGYCNTGVECELEFDNDTEAIYIWNYEGYHYSHYKIADSIHELILNAESIWSNASDDELFPPEEL